MLSIGGNGSWCGLCNEKRRLAVKIVKSASDSPAEQTVYTYMS